MNAIVEMLEPRELCSASPQPVAVPSGSVTPADHRMLVLVVRADRKQVRSDKRSLRAVVSADAKAAGATFKADERIIKLDIRAFSRDRGDSAKTMTDISNLVTAQTNLQTHAASARTSAAADAAKIETILKADQQQLSMDLSQLNAANGKSVSPASAISVTWLLALHKSHGFDML